MAPFLQIQNVVKEFSGVRAVDDVSLSIGMGEIFALLGSSGCGKSTLLRVLAGFESPTAGQILLNGQDITAIPPYQRPINMMFQSYALFPHLSVWENIAFGLRREGMGKDEMHTRVEQMLSLVQLSAFGKRKPHQLSGGQQQRVALARSLAKRPQLLLLDEPLGALDKKLRERTQLELVSILQQVGVTCVLVTHDQEEAMTMASRIAVMSQGVIRQTGKPQEIYESPNCRFVADFIGSVNLLQGRVVEDESDHVVIASADCDHYVGHGITGTLDMEVAVAVRPEKVAISTEAPLGRYNWVRGEITELAYLGSYTVYHLRLASGTVLKAVAINTVRYADFHPQRGQHVYASWSDDSMVVLTQ
ncbi:polyamine ABC transporter ATP-binding protein [Duganella sp. FT135W]|uniref:Spermidine/putrescine import ATP-binding protein PotA n=1 Tax=Duganella flavida TaxID=2692175 RepID=A0A6L8K9U3_9BURK|nr:polyamine ABC transporter ATP-binding protein [Duganella flavida]MYM24243.1 polyamine ABC transporter ATP-binding protein [Duganella flavida]